MTQIASLEGKNQEKRVELLDTENNLEAKTQKVQLLTTQLEERQAEFKEEIQSTRKDLKEQVVYG